MNKAELIDAVAEAADLNKASATRAVDAMLSGIVGALKKGEQVALVGFGTFEVRERAARTAGRASPLQGECWGFDPLSTHQGYMWSGSSVG
ncbi:MAG: HU family DNA-binding protein [Gammaproteobacteria bacterium]|nr:HU family DNA-binding protein [Gammaproteobacteria bacterium]